MVKTADAWVLSPDEFRILWESQPLRAPFPAGFAHGSHVQAPDADTARGADETTRSRLSAASSPLKARAFASLTRPRCSIGVIGSARRHDGRTRPLRIHSGWRHGEELAFVATQRPADDAADPSVAITAHPMKEWTSALLGALPPCPGKGRLANDTDVDTTVERIFESSVRVVSPSAAHTTAAAAFVHLQPVMGAVFTVSVGSLADGHTPTSMDVHIADIPSDGRYALILDRPTVAAGIDAARAATVLTNVLNGLQRQHDARIEDQWHD